MSWQPLLEGALAEQAQGAVLRIARAIAAGEGDPAPVTDRALFWAYVAGAFDDAWIADAYDATIAELVTDAPNWFGTLGLYGGAAAIGFTIAHVSEPGAAETTLEAVDAMIADALVGPWTRDYDLISGLAGFGVYLLERGDAPSARAALDRVVDQLIATSIVDGSGRTWLTAAALIPEHMREGFPDGAFNCGIAHGIPGAIAFLARAAEAGRDRAGTIAAEASRWLAVNYVLGPDRHYPAWIDRDRRDPPAGARHAWCYGDAGASIAMFGAARRLAASTEPALALARTSASRPFVTSGITDAGLCHGAGGLAHIYNRLAQASGDRDLADASRTWFAQALRLADVTATTAFLEGSLGTALALLAATRADEPNWDRLLLCDVS